MSTCGSSCLESLHIPSIASLSASEATELAILQPCLSLKLLHCCRWDASKPAAVDNLVLLTFAEAEEHEAQTLQQVRDHDPEFAKFVDVVLKQAC